MADPETANEAGMYDTMPEEHQGDGTNLTRPATATNYNLRRTDESLRLLGAGQDYPEKNG